MPQDASALTYDAYCAGCGYNLRGLPGTRCPECGRSLSPSELSASQIPWLRRKTIGRLKAFLQTLTFATFHPRQLVPPTSVGLALVDARRFRLICTLLLALPICVGLLMSMRDLYEVPGGYPVDSWSGQLVSLAHIALGLWPMRLLFGIAAAHFLSVLPARLASFPKYPETQRENIIIAAHYLVGALLSGAIIGAITGVLWFSALAVSSHHPITARELTVAASVTAGLFALILWITAIWRFFRQVSLPTGRSAWRPILIAPGIVLLWLFAWAVILPLCVALLITIARVR